MNPDSKTLLKELKKLKFATAQVRLFFFRRYLSERKLSVSVFEPEITPELGERLATSVASRIANANAIQNYAPLTVDADDSLLMAKPTEVNWDAIQSKLNGSSRSAVKAAERAEDLKDCEFYIAEFDFSSGPAFYAAKRLPQKLSVSRLKFDQWLFKGGKLDAMADGRVFNVVLGVDFFSWRDHVFVAEKKVFESIMNIRDGMIKKRDDLLQELQKLDRFDGLDSFSASIGDNAHMLRRVAQVSASGNTADSGFLNTLFEVVGQHPQWGIEVKDGKIVITRENSDGVLSLLNDARAESFIRRQVFDAVIKKPV